MKNNITIFILIYFSLLKGQDYPPPTDLITIPTAGTLMRGSFSMNMRVQAGGGLIMGLRTGITDRFQFGLSFGSSNLIGDDSLVWYPRPEANIKYLISNESVTFPAVALGLNTQGFGSYNDTLERYDTKAFGLYFSGSKNWTFPLGNIGVHSGVSYNFLENLDGDKDPNLFFGFDVELNPELSILLEYNSALNENEMTAKTMSISRGGYLNTAFRWSFVESFYLEFNCNNLLFDDRRVETFKREIKITYIEYF